jgi:hypothetical protein
MSINGVLRCYSHCNFFVAIKFSSSFLVNIWQERKKILLPSEPHFEPGSNCKAGYDVEEIYEDLNSEARQFLLSF